MLVRLLLLFTAVPLVELFLLLWISSKTSAVFTVALVIVTGMVGATVARQQGWHTWRRIQEQLAAGQTPASELIDGLLILIAGTLLITPGVLTDLLGVLLLVPAGRRCFKRIVSDWLKSRAVIQFQHFGHDVRARQDDRTRAADDTVIDAEFTRRPAPPDDE